MEGIKKVKNPVKEMACHLAHQMDREKEINEIPGFCPRQAEWIILDGKVLTKEISKKGYNIFDLLAYADEYKTLGFKEYFEWIYI